jgi:hypothetical protein
MAKTLKRREFARNRRVPRAALVAAVALVAVLLAAGEPAAAKQPKAVPLEDAKMIIEFNSSDQDVGVQFFLDGEGWKTVDVFAPQGKKIFSATATGSLFSQGGGTELFMESEEPPLDELPLEEFFERFPEGDYLFVGRTADGHVRLVGNARFTHDIPAGAEIVGPPGAGGEDCAQNVPIPAVIAWHAVTTSIEVEPLDIAGYQVVIEHGDQVFDIKLTADRTSVTVPPEFLDPGTRYGFELLAIEEGGNQTIAHGCFVTAN